MDTLGFVTTVIIVTASGALAPGPLFFATISQGAKRGVKAGLIFSAAHSLVEFSLVLLVSLGLLSTLNLQAVRSIVGAAGGITLIVMGLLQIRSSLKSPISRNEGFDEKEGHSLLVLGLALTGLNPFVIMWWLTVGGNLILLALEFASFPGVLFMYLCHVWIDYAWLVLVAHFAKKGVALAGRRSYRIIVALFGGALLYFGGLFLLQSLEVILNV